MTNRPDDDTLDSDGPPADARAADTAEAPHPETGRKRPKPGERRAQILQTLAGMLEQPGAERVTTAALALAYKTLVTTGIEKNDVALIVGMVFKR